MRKNTTGGLPGWTIKAAVYVVFLVLCVITMANLNQIVGLILDDISATKLENYVSTANGRAYLDSADAEGDFYESAKIVGWVFAETDQPNDDKYIRVVLASDTACYEVEPKLVTRTGVASTFADSYSIMGNRHGFSAEFSTVGMPDGDYRIYAYAHENESAQILVPFSKMMTKVGDQVTFGPIVERAEKVSQLPSASTENVYSDVNNFALVEGNTDVFSIKGWGYCETEGDNTNKEMKLYLVNGGNIYRYDTQLYEREDVYKAHHEKRNVIGVMHGFSCNADTSSLPDGTYDIYLGIYETDTEQGLVKLDEQVVVGALMLVEEAQ